MRNPDSKTRRRDTVRRANRAIVASWREHLAPLRPHAIDAGLAVVVAVGGAPATRGALTGGGPPPHTPAHTPGGAIGAPLLARRRLAPGVVGGAGVARQGYYF